MDDLRAFCAALCAAAIFGGVSSAGAQPPDAGIRVAKLVKQLGADEFSARRAADLELLKLGPEGRRQLEQAAAAEDPEIRLRAKNLLERLAVVQIWEPTRVTHTANDERVAATLVTCAAQTGNHIFTGDPYGEFSNVPVAIEFKQKSYWQAIDELARLTNNHVRIHYDSRTPGVVVASGPVGHFPIAYSGPIRAQITSARRVFIEELDYEDHRSEITHTFQLNVQLMWEDRFKLAAYGTQPEIVEAKADTGVTIGATQPSASGWNIASPSTRQVTASLRLNPPSADAKKLSLLKLKWSLVALGEMATVELDNVTAKSQLHHDDLTLTVSAIDKQPTGRIEMTLLVSRDIAVPDPPEIQFQENEIELLDSEGKLLRQQSQSHTLGDRGVEFRLAYLAEPTSVTPLKLRFRYPKLRSRRDLEIIFHDVPLPVQRPE